MFIRIICFIFDNSYFKFDGGVYKQFFGCAMGNPASPVLANFVMCDLFDEFFRQVTFDIPFLHLYVDDVIACVPEDKVLECKNILDSIDVNLKFTYELESSKCLPFLDMLLIRKENKIEIDYYRKPTLAIDGLTLIRTTLPIRK